MTTNKRPWSQRDSYYFPFGSVNYLKNWVHNKNCKRNISIEKSDKTKIRKLLFTFFKWIQKLFFANEKF